MSDLIDRISAHFESLGSRSREIPEWDLTVHWTPVTIAERNQIYKDNASANDYETVVNIIIVKATDAEGKKLFTIADKPKLIRRADSSLLTDLAAAIMDNSAPKAEELKDS